ncbi:hypothetical protein J7T55_003581 [Diaporthe amygdali]|uniref:uncharacterized protein n=1 Tax=Phomopsis amygdali TaxID=1214568 RepID=UPI0022FEDCCC|nr:uncharacterized protein J7T55_003581 [Diaporthe amygdali]KAJ0117164.1 hypothetical protein J7T55_003581 [Diaporthe amygdali]
MTMSPNVQELDSPNRKRTHTQYSDHVDDSPACDTIKDPQLGLIESPSIGQYGKNNHAAAGDSAVPGTAVADSMNGLSLDSSLPIPSSLASAQSTPAQSSPLSLTEAGSSDPSRISPSPDTPSRQLPIMPPAKSTQSAGQAPPAKKRKKLTDEERKAQAEEKAAKEAEKEKKRKEKEARDQEKKAEADKKKAEAEKKKAETDKKKAEADKKKAEIERKKREKEEEAERKQRAQPKIGSFFTKQPSTSTPKEARARLDLPGTARSPSPAIQERNEYQRIAQEFFVKENVTLASNKFALSPGSQAARTAILDDFVAGRKSPISDLAEALRLPKKTVQPRGKIYPSVRGLLSSHGGIQASPIDLTTESQNLRIQTTQQSLKKIPLKHLKFHEDVRPAYYGTATSVESLASLQKLAKNPIAKDLPLNYDYDSEAEWVDGDDGEGDDVSLMDEEDADEDDGEAMDDFLDDSEDVGRGPRMFAGTMEPESSGVCFEDRTRRNPNPQMYKFRMEFMIPNLKHHHSIDPFSDQYWVQEPKASAPKAASVKSTAQSSVDKAADGAMAPPPAPSAFAALGATSTPAVSNVPAPEDLVPADQLEGFKATVVEFSFLPKAAMIATLKKKLDHCTSTQIKATLDHVAEKPNKKGDWRIKSGL